MTTLFLSRAVLRREAPVAALAPILLPADGDTRINTTHRLVWSLFADAPERSRDFLWRDESAGGGRLGQHFYILSARPPEDRIALFDIESRRFEPQLAKGSRLRFSLRANPTVAAKQAGAKRGKRIDPVARELAKLSKDERAARRYEITTQVGQSWLAKQGERAGFLLPPDPATGRPRVSVDGTSWRVVPRGKSHSPMSFGVLDFEGELEVSDPDAFLTALPQGFGKAKAFGCGLMLIRRA
jgi:CRISPR system Cascade subunit CasE